jgi:hypothetical protein
VDTFEERARGSQCVEHLGGSQERAVAEQVHEPSTRDVFHRECREIGEEGDGPGDTDTTIVAREVPVKALQRVELLRGADRTGEVVLDTLEATLLDEPPIAISSR